MEFHQAGIHAHVPARYVSMWAAGLFYGYSTFFSKC